MYRKEVGHQIFVRKPGTDTIMKKIDTRMEKNDKTTLEELRLQSQKEIIVAVTI